MKRQDREALLKKYSDDSALRAAFDELDAVIGQRDRARAKNGDLQRALDEVLSAYPKCREKAEGNLAARPPARWWYEHELRVVHARWRYSGRYLCGELVDHHAHPVVRRGMLGDVVRRMEQRDPARGRKLRELFAGRLATKTQFREVRRDDITRCAVCVAVLFAVKDEAALLPSALGDEFVEVS